MDMQPIGIAILDSISVSVRKSQAAFDVIDKLELPGFIAARIACMSAATREQLGANSKKWLRLSCGTISIDYDMLGTVLIDIEVDEMQSEEIQKWLTQGASINMIRNVMGVSHRRVSDQMAAVKIAMPDGPYANGRAAIVPAVAQHISKNQDEFLVSMPGFAKLARRFDRTLPEIWASYKSVVKVAEQ